MTKTKIKTRGGESWEESRTRRKNQWSKWSKDGGAHMPREIESLAKELNKQYAKDQPRTKKEKEASFGYAVAYYSYIEQINPKTMAKQFAVDKRDLNIYQRVGLRSRRKF